MATNSTLLQQAFELRKANPNMTVWDAVSQVKANTTPAPAAPLPTTPQAPLPTAKAGDVVVWVNWEKFVQANNQDLSTNVTWPSQVVNQSGQDMSKLEQVQAQAFGRREGLQTQGLMPNNPNPAPAAQTTTTQQAPAPTTPVAPTPTTTPTTKATPVQVQPTDENSIMTVLKTNWPITDEIKNSPSYTQVKQVYDKVKQFSTYSVNNLVTALNNGAILPGTKVYNEMLNDPTLRQKLTEAQVFTAKQPVNTQAVTQSVSNEIFANNPTTAGAFADGTLTPDEYSKLTNTPEVIAKAQDVEAKTNKYNTLKAEYDDIEAQVNKDFAWSPFADAIIADRQKAKYKNLVLAKWELDSAIWTLTELKSTAANIFETNLKLYQDQRQQDNAYKMAQYQAQLSKDAAQYQNQLQQGNFKLQNQYDLQKMGIANEYDMQKLWVSNQYDMQKFAASNKFDLQKLGISNQQDLQKLALQYNMKNTGDIQSARIDLMGKWATPEQADSIIRNATWNWKWASGEVLLGAVDGTIIPTRLSQTTNPNGGKECAEYVNDITGAWLGSTWESKQAKIDTNITTPKAGDTAIWIPDPSNKQFAQYGHAGVVMWSDWTNVTIKSSNLNGQGEISTIIVPIEQIKQTGGFANTAIKQYKTTQSQQPSLPLYRSYMEDWKLPSKDALKWLWMTSEQFTESAQTWYDSYLTNKAKEINSTYPTLQVEFTPAYSTLSATQREKLNDSMTKIWDIDQRIEKLKTLFNKSWTEILPTNDKAEMESLRKQIILKAKEVENLGVLNWPDMWILDSIIPETTGLVSGLFSFDSNTLKKLNSVQTNYRSDAKTKGINYWTRISFKWEDAAMQQTQQINSWTTQNKDPLWIR